MSARVSDSFVLAGPGGDHILRLCLPDALSAQHVDFILSGRALVRLAEAIIARLEQRPDQFSPK